MPVLKSSFKLAAVCLSVIAVWAPAHAAITQPLDDLRRAASASLAPNESVASIAMVFQPDCAWCKKQGQTMAELQHRCDNQLNIAIIGYKAKYRELRRELKHFDQDLPALAADRRFLAAVEGVAATPTTLFFDQNGELLLKQRGYMKPEQLRAAANALAKTDCAAEVL